MSLDAWSLVKLALGIWVLAGICLGTEQDQPGWKAVRDAVAGLLGQLGLVCAGAALFIWLAPWWTTGPLGEMTLLELRDEQQRFVHWAGRAWFVPAAFSALALSGAALGWGVVRDHRARWLGSALAWTLKLKAVAGLAALFSLSALAMQHRAEANAAAMSGQIKMLTQLRLSLAEDAARAAFLALAEPMAKSLPSTAQLPRLAKAYWIAEPHLAVPEWHPQGDGWRTGLGAAVERRLDDRSTVQAANADQQLRRVEWSDITAQQRLLATLLEAGFDQAVSGPFMERFATLGHPLVDELFRAVVDPLFAKPLRDAVVTTASAALRSGDARAAMRQQAEDAWMRMPSVARGRLAAATKRAARAMAERDGQEKAALGDPRWQAARDHLLRGFRPGPSGVRDRTSAHQAWIQTASVRQALDEILVSETARQAQAELAFGHMLLHGNRHLDDDTRPHLLAAWGKALAQQMNIATPSGEPNAYAGLMRWYATQPDTLRNAARQQLDPKAATEDTLAAHEIARMQEEARRPASRHPVHSVHARQTRRAGR